MAFQLLIDHSAPSCSVVLSLGVFGGKGSMGFSRCQHGWNQVPRRQHVIECASPRPRNVHTVASSCLPWLRLCFHVHACSSCFPVLDVACVCASRCGLRSKRAAAAGRGRSRAGGFHCLHCMVAQHFGAALWCMARSHEGALTGERLPNSLLVVLFDKATWHVRYSPSPCAITRFVCQPIHQSRNAFGIYIQCCLDRRRTFSFARNKKEKS